MCHKSRLSGPSTQNFSQTVPSHAPGFFSTATLLRERAKFREDIAQYFHIRPEVEADSEQADIRKIIDPAFDQPNANARASSSSSRFVRGYAGRGTFGISSLASD